MTNNNKYSTEESVKILEEILMRMSYTPTKTLSENFNSITILNYKKSNYKNPYKILQEQEVTKDSEIKKEEEAYTQRLGTIQLKDEFYNKPGFKVIKTPGDLAIYVPKETKILSIAEGGLKGFTKNFINWLDPIHGGKGTTITQNWMNTDWDKLIPEKSVWSFKTTDGNVYTAVIQNPVLNKIEDWEDFAKLKPEPEKWMFYGYYDKNNKPYNSEPVKTKPWYLEFWEFVKNNWDFLAYLIVSVVIGVLTGGQSVFIQAMAQLLVDIAFVVPLILEGDYFGAGVIFIISLIPFINTLRGFGKKAPLEFIKKYGQELSKIKTVEEFDKFVTKLTPQESELLARVLKQTPQELKKITQEGVSNVMTQAVHDGKVFLPDIPLKDRMWVKNLYELSLMTGLAVSIHVGKYIYDINEFRNEWEKSGLNKEKVTNPQPKKSDMTINKTENKKNTENNLKERGLSDSETKKYKDKKNQYNIRPEGDDDLY